MGAAGLEEIIPPRLRVGLPSAGNSKLQNFTRNVIYRVENSWNLCHKSLVFSI
jgi:hypothetical protein